MPPIPSGDASADEPGEAVDPSSLPFSAGIKPGEEESALIGKVNQEVDAAFIEGNLERGRARRLNDLKGKDLLYEYACSEDSIIGQRADQLGIKCVRLTRLLLDLENLTDVEQAIGQLEESPGAGFLCP